jgi:hypothetical protein
MTALGWLAVIAVIAGAAIATIGGLARRHERQRPTVPIQIVVRAVPRLDELKRDARALVSDVERTATVLHDEGVGDGS